MEYFVVISEWGPGWDRSRSMREQRSWDDHAGFMNAINDEGFVVLGGPLIETDAADHVHRALLIVTADSADTVRTRLATDPWIQLQILRTVRIDRWDILLGELPTST